jgi:hypothetical protein
LKKLKELKKKKLNSGQALVEYVLVLVISVSIAYGFNSFFRQIIGQGILKFNAVLESELRSSEFRSPEPYQIWSN